MSKHFHNIMKSPKGAAGTQPELRFPNSVAYIDFRKLKSNLTYLKSKAGEEKKIMAVVKADAYSHGAVKTAIFLEPLVDWFAVASVDEGIQLRMAEVQKPILVFGVPCIDTAAAYGRYNLAATVSHESHFSILTDGTRYHINFDTGMGRLGFKAGQSDLVRSLAVKNQRLICSGLYTHYALADEPDSLFVEKQHQDFEQIAQSFSEIPNKHISNTGAAIHYSLNHYDMLRVGIGLWGYTPGKKQDTKLQPVLTWKSKLVQVRSIAKGETVSYGASWSSPMDGYIGTIPVGYADGLPRSLSNRLDVMINGEFYKVAGNVTMDYTMVYLGSNQPEAGTVVTLMGGNGLPANRWAELAETNTHEILTNLTGRVKKEYSE